MSHLPHILALAALAWTAVADGALAESQGMNGFPSGLTRIAVGTSQYVSVPISTSGPERPDVPPVVKNPLVGMPSSSVTPDTPVQPRTCVIHASKQSGSAVPVNVWVTVDGTVMRTVSIDVLVQLEIVRGIGAAASCNAEQIAARRIFIPEAICPIGSTLVYEDCGNGNRL